MFTQNFPVAYWRRHYPAPVACPPDVDPILDKAELAERLVRHAEDVSQVRVLPVGAMTWGLAGSMLAEMSLLRDAGCIAVSQGRGLPPDTRVLWRALQYAASCDVPVWLQPAEYHLSKEGIAHDSALASRLGLAAIPVAAETLAMQTVLALAKATGARVHFTQISSAEGVALLREARDAGLPVTGDVAAHALHLYEQTSVTSIRSHGLIRHSAVSVIVKRCAWA